MKNNTNDTYDYVILGAGAAGCVLANRLSVNHRVLLAEAGGNDSHPYIHMPAGFAKLTGTSHSWGYSTKPQPQMNDRAIWYPQGKVLGGGTSINAQVYTRGNPKDYDEWARDEKCEGWSFREVLPYFKRSEDNQRLSDRYHAQGGPLKISDPTPHPMTCVFVQAAQQAGIPYNHDFNGETQAGIGYYQLTNRAGKRSSTAVCFYRPVSHRNNLKLLLNCLAVSVNTEGGRARSVSLLQGRRKMTVFAEREILLCCGAIGSPKLLMLSGIGNGEELKKHGIPVRVHLPAVGENLQDHVDLFCISECKGDYSFDKYKPPHMMMLAAFQFLVAGAGPLASNLCDGGGFWQADETARSPDIQMHFLPGSGLEHGLEKIRNGVTLNSAFVRPRSRGSVRLTSADAVAPPLIDPNYWGDEYDVGISIKGFRLAREIMRQSAFRPYIRREAQPGDRITSDKDLRAYAAATAKTDYHPVGTCRMGAPADERSAVTPDLKVKGVEGLRVIDASVMPAVISSNTNAPTIMIAEKGADLVLGNSPLPPASA